MVVLIGSRCSRYGRRAPGLTFWSGGCGMWWMLIPVVGLVQIGEQAMADRYTYVSLIGLFIIIAWGGPICCAAACPASCWPYLR